MLRRIACFLLLISGIWIVYQNRFRIINVLFGNRIIRRMFVYFIMSLPFVRDRMVKTVFSGMDS